MELMICIKMDLALNNLQKLICHKTQPTNLNKNQTHNLVVISPYFDLSDFHGFLTVGVSLAGLVKK